MYHAPGFLMNVFRALHPSQNQCRHDIHHFAEKRPGAICDCGTQVMVLSRCPHCHQLMPDTRPIINLLENDCG